MRKLKNKVKEHIRKVGPIYRTYRKMSRLFNMGPEDYYTVIDDWKVVFFYLPKNANTSLKRAIYKKLYGRDTKSLHKNFPKTRFRSPNKKGYFKFVIVRNPYDRLVSAYKNKIVSPGQTGVINSQKELYRDMPFKDFVKAICRTPDSKLDRHFRPQSWFIKDKNGKIIPDFIGKFENLPKDYETIMKKIGFKNFPELSTDNKEKRKRNYRTYYDEETKNLVRNKYKEDLNLFDYEF
ncbi:MAG: sulfotransferase family protein [Candidatus Pacearchaeota archaeon]